MKQHITHLFLLLILCFCAQAQTPYVDANGRVRYYKSGVSQAPKVDCTQIPQWTQKFNQYRRNSTIGGDVTIPASGTTATLTDVLSSSGSVGSGQTIPGVVYDKKGRITGTTAYSLLIGNVAGGLDSIRTRTPFHTVATLRASGNTTPEKVINLYDITQPGREGTFVLDASDATTADNGGTVLVTASGKRYKRPIADGEIKVDWFDARNDASADASAAIQGAVNAAKSLLSSLTNTGNTNRATIRMGGGMYVIQTSINLTNSEGLWIKGAGGAHINTQIIGATGQQAIFDFSGSNYSGCEDLTIRGGGTSTTTSRIAVQFALTDISAGLTGGLNCIMSNVHIFLNDIPTSGTDVFGSIGILNVRAEEFKMFGCTIQSNAAAIFSYSPNLAATGYSYTVTSPYATISAGTGSMGNVYMYGCEFHVMQRRAPALILNGANTIRGDLYIGRKSSNLGTNETAILAASGLNNFQALTTIESFSTFLTSYGTVQNCDFHGLMSAGTDESLPVFDVTNCPIFGTIFQPSFVSFQTRTLIYHAPGGTGYLKSCQIICGGLADDKRVISPALLKRSDNTSFHTNHPFEKRAGWIRQLSNQEVYLGTVSGTLSTSAIYQFNEARVSGTTTQNAGFYTIVVDGTLMVGAENDGNVASMAFSSRITVAMKPDGTPTVSSHTNFIDQSTTSTGFGNITNLVAGVTFSGGVGTVTLTPTVGGATGAVVNFAGTTKIYSKFLFNDIIPF